MAVELIDEISALIGEFVGTLQSYDDNGSHEYKNTETSAAAVPKFWPLIASMFVPGSNTVVAAAIPGVAPPLCQDPIVTQPVEPAAM